MITSRTLRLSPDASPIPRRVLAYYRRRLQHELHELVVREFLKKQISKKALAKRLGRNEASISRWLGAPGNWTLRTFSDLMVGMGLDPRVVLMSPPAESLGATARAASLKLAENKSEAPWVPAQQQQNDLDETIRRIRPAA